MPVPGTPSRASAGAAGRALAGAALALLAILAPALAQTVHGTAAGSTPPQVAAGAAASPPAFGLDPEGAVRASRAALGGTPGDYVLRDRSGQPVSLAAYRGKPLLVNFIYTGCFQVCPTSSRALRRAVEGMRERFGEAQFNVVSIGFNQPTDSPQALRQFAAQQRIDEPNWEFLSPAAGDVAALARDFGFSFAPTPIGFDHTLQVSVLDAEGRLYRQVYGDAFTADALGEPLRQLVTGALVAQSTGWSDLLDRVRILCSVYDPVTGTYRVDYSLYLQIAGGATFILAMLWFVLHEWRTRRAARRPQAA
jgi:protein SCO1/2